MKGVAIGCRNHGEMYFQFAGPRPVRIFRDFDGAASRAPLNPGHGARLACNRQRVPDLRSDGRQYNCEEDRARKSQTINESSQHSNV
jgi:hypothetical protein